MIITSFAAGGNSRTKPEMESAEEPVEWVYFRGAQCVRSINRPISSLSGSPKCWINCVTMYGGVQSGRVHDVMVLCEPLMPNDWFEDSDESVDKSCVHTGQQRFDVPIIGAYCYQPK
jgi:hypothetical protein